MSATPEPRPLVFPDDDAPHRDPREWWYYNGHLSDDLGRKYGFHFVVFHVRQPGFPPVFLSQMGVTDVTDSNYAEGGAAFLVSGAKDGEQLAVTGAGWRLAIGNGTHALEGKIDGTSLSITLRPRKPPALHNKIGWLSGPKGWTYYYSYTRMEASGTLVIDGREVAVSGKAWMDHQWGDFDLPSFPSGWQWFALQLDDGADLMITEPRDDRGNVGPLYGTLVAPDGETRALVETADGISLDVLGSWTSSRTGAEYPAAWRLKVDSAGLDLDLQPVVANQEVPFAGPLPAYWEGKVTVTGTRGGAEISGDGYAELTGYAIRSARQPGAQ